MDGKNFSNTANHSPSTQVCRFFLSFRGHVRDLTVTVKAFWPSPIVSCLDARVRKVERIWFPEYSEFGQRYVRSPGSEPAV